MDGDTIDLRGILQLLRRRFWLIVLVTVVALGVAGVALFALKPVFTATTLVLVDPSKKNLLDPEAQLNGSASDSVRVDSEVELVKSETTLLEVAQELNLTSDSEFGLKLGLRDTLMAFFRIAEPTLPTGDEALRAIIAKLREAVTVQRRGLTFLIAVNAKSERGDFAAEIANAVARGYIREQLEAKVASTLASRDVIQGRIADANAKVAQSEGAFDDFIDQNLARISESTGRTDLLAMRDDIQALAQKRATTASLTNLAEQGLARRDWSAIAASLKDDAITNLERQRAALVDQLAGATSGSQAAIDLRASLSDIEGNLETVASKAITALRQDVSNSQARVSELRTQLRSSLLNSDLPSDALTNIYELQQNADIARTLYQTLLTRQNDLDTQAFLQVADSRIVSEATPPDTPSFPNPRLILLLAGFAGVGLGVLLALLIENFVGGFTSVAQTESLLRIPVVGSIPRQKQLRHGGVEAITVADALILAPLSIYSESIRKLRIGIDQAIRKVVKKDESEVIAAVVVVTSAVPGEGKTTVALSLARAYALSGVSTLLVDCDLRKPSVNRQLGVKASNGLLEYLSGSTQISDLQQIMILDSGTKAQIILGSRQSDVATDQLIGGKTFTRLLDSARRNFDIVILDTPPIVPVVDGLYLAGMADAVVVVAKWSGTPQQEVKTAVGSLLAAKAEAAPLLAVLNQQEMSSAAYRGKYSSYYTVG